MNLVQRQLQQQQQSQQLSRRHHPDVRPTNTKISSSTGSSNHDNIHWNQHSSYGCPSFMKSSYRIGTTALVLLTIAICYNVYGIQQQLEMLMTPTKATMSYSSKTTTIANRNGQETVLVLCVDDRTYGQTFNQILTIAAARTIASELTRTLNTNANTTASPVTPPRNNYITVKVGLGPISSAMYDAVLLPQDDILLHYYRKINRPISDHQSCDYKYTSNDLFDLFFTFDWYPHRVQMIQSLIPNQYIQEQAVRYMQQYRDLANTNVITTTAPPVTEIMSSAQQQRRIITVHRRYFEGKCPRLVKNRDRVACLNGTNANRKNTTVLMTDAELVHTCNINYNDIVQDDLSHQQQNTEKQTGYDSTAILLCTDRQVRKHDMTFPNIVTIPRLDKSHRHKATLVMIEAWIMTLSDIHYGVPMSTIDVVIHFWRRNNSSTTSLSTSTISKTITTSTEQREMRPIVCYGDDS
jgi:hypothetical protein